MKKRPMLNVTAAILLAAMVATTGCGSSANNTSGSSAAGSSKETTAAKDPTNTYTAENGMFAVTLPGTWETGDNMGMSNFLMLKQGAGTESIIFGMKKGQILGGGDVDNLEEFFEYVEATFFGAPAMSTTLTEADGFELPGTLQTIAKSGDATQTSNGAKAKLFIEVAETEDAYYCFSFTSTKDLDKVMTSIKAALVFEELTPPVAEGLSSTLRWFNASCAVIIKLNNGDLTMVAGFEPNISITSGMKAMLSRDWDITDAASLYETIDWLMAEGHNQDALNYLDRLSISGDTREDVIAALKADGTADDDIVMIMAAYDAKTAYGDAAISGWDYSRAMSILGWGYLAEFLTYEEAMDKSLELAAVIQPQFDSWDDFYNSYLLGYSYWSGNSVEDTSSNAYKRHQIYEELKNEDNGVFAVDFKEELQKEW